MWPTKCTTSGWERALPIWKAGLPLGHCWSRKAVALPEFPQRSACPATHMLCAAPMETVTARDKANLACAPARPGRALGEVEGSVSQSPSKRQGPSWSQPRSGALDPLFLAPSQETPQDE